MTKLGISVAISHGSSSIAGFGLVFLRQSMAPQSSVHFEERPFILYSVVLGRKKVQQIVSTTAAPLEYFLKSVTNPPKKTLQERQKTYWDSFG